MPKGGRKGEKKNNRDIASDVKLSDFADCSSAHPGRLRKSAGSNLDKEAQGVSSSEDLWYERDLDDFEFPSTSTEIRKKQIKCKVTSQDLNNRPGIQYPIDIWYLIGRFVKPEDVKTFAAICKGSYFVSRTYSFWITMYKRHYQPDTKLPQRLQPECIEGSLCLKVYVIRALYHMYPRFTSLLSRAADVYSLSNLCCTSMWRVQQNEKWLFHFKLQAPSAESPTSPLNYRLAIQDMWTSQEGEEKACETYVNHNPDEGCKVLRISCSHFVVVSPSVMGSRLADVRIDLAHDMRRQKLQLTFGYSNYRQTNIGKGGGMYGNVIEFDPVENITILNWWHPQYPGCKV
jgi:hypothetical protein